MVWHRIEEVGDEGAHGPVAETFVGELVAQQLRVTDGKLLACERYLNQAELNALDRVTRVATGRDVAQPRDGRAPGTGGGGRDCQQVHARVGHVDTGLRRQTILKGCCGGPGFSAWGWARGRALRGLAGPELLPPAVDGHPRLDSDHRRL